MGKIKARMKPSYLTLDKYSGISKWFSCAVVFIVIAGIFCCVGKFLSCTFAVAINTVSKFIMLLQIA